ncbi:MAG: hypothetical protein D6794_08010 [Deltaproteobacteria bacterium]|nr:MAG: hypothetical protein D6794_08010 [Deltaproteobacteria bacterium]
MTKIQIARDEAICRQCRGLCCQGAPGLWADPDRFVQLFFPRGLPEGRDLELALKRLGLTWRRVTGVAIAAPKRTETGCLFLTEQGCRLAPDRRPCQCLALEPSLDTLLTGEIDCRMPAQLRSDRIALRWRRWWQRHPNVNLPAKLP